MSIHWSNWSAEEYWPIRLNMSIHQSDSPNGLNMSIRRMDEYLPSILLWFAFRAHTRKIEEIEENDRRNQENYSHCWFGFTFNDRRNRRKLHERERQRERERDRERETERQSLSWAYLIARESRRISYPKSPISLSPVQPYSVGGGRQESVLEFVRVATVREREREIELVGFGFHRKWKPKPNRNFALANFFSTVGVDSVRYFGIRYTFGEP